MTHAAVIAGVVIRRCLRDPALVAMLVVIPIVGALVFGLADQRANGSLPIGIIRTRGAPLANDLVDQLRDAPELRVHEYRDGDAMTRAIRRGDIYAGVVIAEDYDAHAVAGEATELSIVGDESQSTFDAAHSAVLLVAEREQLAHAVAQRLARERQSSLVDAMPAARATVEASPVTTERVTSNELTRATGLARSTAGMLVFFVFAIAMGYATVLVGDRHRGVLSRAATTCATDQEIIAGEIGGRLAISALQGFLIVVLSALIFDIRWGDPLGVALVVLLFSVVSSCVAVVIGCRLRGSQEQSVWLTDGLMAVLGVLGGCFFSLQLLPAWVRGFGHLSPHAWAVDAFDRLIGTNADVGAIAPSLLVLAAFGAASFAIAVRQLRRALEG